jgi:FkbM family methyltransferase
MFRDTRRVLVYVWTHPANRGARLRGIGRGVAFQIRGFLGMPTMTTIGGNTRMWAVRHYAAASKVLYANPPDWPEMQAWRRILKPGDLFVDVGSNVGAYALWAADMGVRVIAIEPGRRASEWLRRNVALNGHPIEVVECALGAETGYSTLTAGKDTTNHLVLEIPDSPGSAATGCGTTVRVDTLDGLVGDRTVAGVKIDVEGAERLVLAGATRAIGERRVAVLQIEWNRQSEMVFGEDRSAIVAMLSQHGYTFMRPDRTGRLLPTDPSGYGADIFAVADAASFVRSGPGAGVPRT